MQFSGLDTRHSLWVPFNVLIVKCGGVALSTPPNLVGVEAPAEAELDGVIDIKTDYEATHGAVNEAAPKVFLKYFYVNTKTGEKSGEMMAMITLN